MDVVKVFSASDPLFPNHLQLNNTNGLVIGQLFAVLQDPLPGLVRGQNYYIKSINGNKITISLTQEIGTPIVTFNQTVTGLARVRAGGDLLQFGENYSFNGSILTFLDGNIPEGAAKVKISFNTELKIQNSVDPHFRLPLNGYVSSRDTGLSFSIPEANTAIIEYSVRTSDNLLRVGTIWLITDGSVVRMQETRSQGPLDGISFNGRIESNRLYLTYSNSRNQSANFYYSVKLWNTI